MHPRSLASPFLVIAMLAMSGCATSGVPETPTTSDGCDSGEAIVDRSLRIITTVAPITSIASRIVRGSSTQVTGIVPEGVNSHTFEPSPNDAAVLSTADVVFLNGLMLEEPTRDLALANLAPGAAICELGTRLLPPDEWIYDFSFPEEAGAPNPHLWTNPPMGKGYAEIIRDHVIRRDPTSADLYRSNFDALAEAIDALDAAVIAATSTVPDDRRLLLTYHDAYAYTAERYGWTVIGAIEPSSFDNPSPRDIAAIIEQVRSRNVTAIFGSEVFPSPVLAQIGAETGVRYIDVLRDDDLLGSPGDPEHSWLELMRFNFITIIEAWGGDATALHELDVGDDTSDTAVYPQ